MKALLLVSELEDYTIAFANGLARHIDVVLCVPRRRYEQLASHVDPAVDLRLLDWPRHSSLANPAFLWSLFHLVRRERPDVIHLLSNNILWLNLLLPLWHATPIVTTVHDVDMHPGDRETGLLPGWSPDLAVRQSDALVVHGPRLRRHAAQRFHRSTDDIHVLDHPAIGRYAKMPLAGSAPPRTGSDFTLLLFGRIFAYKGLDLLLRAEAVLGDRVPNLNIVVAGRGDNPADQRHLMGNPGRYDIRNRFIQDQEVADLFRCADAVVLPYVEGSQSGVIALAAAFGVPVIATDVGELRATVEDNGIGMIVPPGNPQVLANAIQNMAEDDERRRQFGRNARRWATGQIAPETVGAEAVAIYRRVIGQQDLPATGSDAQAAADERPRAAEAEPQDLPEDWVPPPLRSNHNGKDRP